MTRCRFTQFRKEAKQLKNYKKKIKEKYETCLSMFRSSSWSLALLPRTEASIADGFKVDFCAAKQSKSIQSSIFFFGNFEFLKKFKYKKERYLTATFWIHLHKPRSTSNQIYKQNPRPVPKSSAEIRALRRTPIPVYFLRFGGKRGYVSLRSVPSTFMSLIQSYIAAQSPQDKEKTAAHCQMEARYELEVIELPTRPNLVIVTRRPGTNFGYVMHGTQRRAVGCRSQSAQVRQTEHTVLIRLENGEWCQIKCAVGVPTRTDTCGLDSLLSGRLVKYKSNFQSQRRQKKHAPR